MKLLIEVEAPSIDKNSKMSVTDATIALSEKSFTHTNNTESLTNEDDENRETHIDKEKDGNEHEDNNVSMDTTDSDTKNSEVDSNEDSNNISGTDENAPVSVNLSHNKDTSEDLEDEEVDVSHNLQNGNSPTDIEEEKIDTVQVDETSTKMEIENCTGDLTNENNVDSIESERSVDSEQIDNSVDKMEVDNSQVENTETVKEDLSDIDVNMADEKGIVVSEEPVSATTEDLDNVLEDSVNDVEDSDNVLEESVSEKEDSKNVLEELVNEKEDLVKGVDDIVNGPEANCTKEQEITTVPVEVKTSAGLEINEIDTSDAATKKCSEISEDTQFDQKADDKSSESKVVETTQSSKDCVNIIDVAQKTQNDTVITSEDNEIAPTDSDLNKETALIENSTMVDQETCKNLANESNYIQNEVKQLNNTDVVKDDLCGIAGGKDFDTSQNDSDSTDNTKNSETKTELDKTSHSEEASDPERSIPSGNNTIVDQITSDESILTPEKTKLTGLSNNLDILSDDEEDAPSNISEKITITEKEPSKIVKINDNNSHIKKITVISENNLLKALDFDDDTSPDVSNEVTETFDKPNESTVPQTKQSKTVNVDDDDDIMFVEEPNKGNRKESRKVTDSNKNDSEGECMFVDDEPSLSENAENLLGNKQIQTANEIMGVEDDAKATDRLTDLVDPETPEIKSKGDKKNQSLAKENDVMLEEDNAKALDQVSNLADPETSEIQSKGDQEDHHLNSESDSMSVEGEAKQTTDATVVKTEIEEKDLHKNQEGDAMSVDSEIPSVSEKADTSEINTQETEITQHSEDTLIAVKKESLEPNPTTEKTSEVQEETTITNEPITDPIIPEEKLLVPSEFLQSFKQTINNMTRDDLEEFCLLKIVEGIADRSHLSEIKSKLKTMMQYVEEWRKKAAFLSKQNRDLQIVIKTIQEEQKKKCADSITPLKITRSVGMQVLMTDSKTNVRRKPIPIQNRNPPNPHLNKMSQVRPVKTPPRTLSAPNPQIPVPRLVPAIASPAKPNPRTSPQQVQNSTVSSNTKPVTVPNGIRTPNKPPEKRPFNSMQSIDLTDDEPPSKQAAIRGPVRVVPQQHLLANNSNQPRKVFIPINGQQNNQIRPGQTIMFKAATQNPRQRMSGPIMRLPGNGPIRMVRNTTKHPAALPQATPQPNIPNCKFIPPAPELKISKVENGIVISWKMDGYREDTYEEIASYQLYAYQETSSPPSSSLWKKIGDVKALPLPMACTLTQFMAGYKYYFAVRAVDVKTRIGPFSLPGSILLLNK